MREATERLAGVLRQPGANQSVRNAIRAVKKIQPSRDQVTFSSLLEVDHPETRLLKTAGYTNRFKQVWEQQSGLPGIQETDSLTAWLLANNIAIYFPYSEEFEEKPEQGVAVTFFDLVNENENSGVYVDLAAQYKSMNVLSSFEDSRVLVNDDYALQHPVYVLLPDEGYQEQGGSTTVSTTTSMTQGWLSNIDERQLKQEDIVHTIIPKIRLTDHYRGVLGGNDFIKFRIVTSKQPVIKIANPSGSHPVFQLDLSPETSFSGAIEIPRTSTRRNNWTNVSYSANIDWDLHERDMLMVVVSTHIVEKAGGEIGYDLSVGAAIEVSPSGDPKIVITGEENVSLSGKVVLGNRDVIRWHGNLTRREVFANINTDLGNGLANWTYGGPYTVRASDKVRYYFVHHHTKFN